MIPSDFFAICLPRGFGPYAVCDQNVELSSQLMALTIVSPTAPPADSWCIGIGSFSSSVRRGVMAPLHVFCSPGRTGSQQIPCK